MIHRHEPLHRHRRRRAAHAGLLRAACSASTEGQRPDLGFPGAWLYAGGPQAVLHIYFDRPVPRQRAGVIDHMAFTASDLKAVKARFDERGIKYDLRRQAGAGTWQLFCHDPNGAKVELDFDPSESL